MDKGKGIVRSIEASNLRFYKAFESLSIQKMEEVWKHSNDVICIHPGWEMFSSWTAIRESWVRIFENTKTIRFLVTNIKIKAFEKLAVVICLENIDYNIEDGNSIRMGVIATNIFEKQNVNSNQCDNQWLMTHHHGSSVANYMPPNVSA